MVKYRKMTVNTIKIACSPIIYAIQVPHVPHKALSAEYHHVNTPRAIEQPVTRCH